MPPINLMGAQLVGRAFAFAATSRLTQSERLVLLFMAYTALDADKPPRYFASREQTAIALGRMVPDAVSPDDDRFAEVEAERTAAFQRVKLAVQGLVKAGAIERVRRGREGQRAEFVLVFGSVENGEHLGTHSVPLDGTHSVPLSESDSVLQQVRDPYPQGTTQEHKEPSPGITSPPRVSHVAPVDGSRVGREAA